MYKCALTTIMGCSYIDLINSKRFSSSSHGVFEGLVQRSPFACRYRGGQQTARWLYILHVGEFLSNGKENLVHIKTRHGGRFHEQYTVSFRIIPMPVRIPPHE